MKGFIIDTSSANALIALTLNGNIEASLILKEAKKLSSLLFPSMESLFKQCDWKIQNLDYIGVGVGPGSYMGIRTAATVAKTLSYGSNNTPLVEFSSPHALSNLPQLASDVYQQFLLGKTIEPSSLELIYSG